jgi:hypothetical protein
MTAGYVRPGLAPRGLGGFGRCRSEKPELFAGRDPASFPRRKPNREPASEPRPPEHCTAERTTRESLKPRLTVDLAGTVADETRHR